MPQKGFTPVLLVILVAVLSIGGYFVYTSLRGMVSEVEPDVAISPTSNQTACTQDAKLCPDGTSVGRVDPNCEFAPCPTPKESTSSADMTNWKTYTNAKYYYPIKFPSEYVAYGISPGYDHSSLYSPENADAVVIVELKNNVEPKDERGFNKILLTISKDTPNIKKDFDSLLNDSTDPNFSQKHHQVKIGTYLGDEYANWYKGQFTAKWILITHGSTFFIINYDNEEGKYFPNYPNNIEEQILSTFKFLP